MPKIFLGGFNTAHAMKATSTIPPGAKNLLSIKSLNPWKAPENGANIYSEDQLLGTFRVGWTDKIELLDYHTGKQILACDSWIEFMRSIQAHADSI